MFLSGRKDRREKGLKGMKDRRKTRMTDTTRKGPVFLLGRNDRMETREARALRFWRSVRSQDKKHHNPPPPPKKKNTPTHTKTTAMHHSHVPTGTVHLTPRALHYVSACRRRRLRCGVTVGLFAVPCDSDLFTRSHEIANSPQNVRLPPRAAYPDIRHDAPVQTARHVC